MAVPNKRKKSVVDARVQWTLAGRVVMHFFTFICAGAALGLIFQYLSDPLASPSQHMHNFWVYNAPMLIVLVCLIPIFIRDTLTLSNRIAGPICRLRDTVKRMGNGEEMPPLKFRKNDMWDDLPELFNRMTERLQEPTASSPHNVTEAQADALEQISVQLDASTTDKEIPSTAAGT